ncbi:plasmid replication protein RepC [Thioclava sp. GXIMD4216]|uniref:plasmid replication protein RepC n=1 Tax=Thioclava sp. GXIMD4216 TaxID=3131929 RepID=UPI0030D31E47
MTYFSTRMHGQPVQALPDGPVLSADKWAIVEDLTEAAADFGLTHRSIAVLRAMLTFFPERSLPALPGRAIVFASNDSLGTRLGGMPESTLRRHLAALVSAGVIARHDSPNRKRYAKRIGGTIARAFGFDLAPLAQLARRIHQKACDAQARAQEHAALRQDVLVARHDLLSHLPQADRDEGAHHSHSALLARTKLILRHKNNTAALKTLLQDYTEALAQLGQTGHPQMGYVEKAAEMDASNSENERHQQRVINKKNPEPRTSGATDIRPEDPDLEASGPEISRPERQGTTQQASGQADRGNRMGSALPVLADFTEYCKMYPETARDWRELHQQTTQLVAMMGIDAQVYEEAQHIMGTEIASIAVLCLLERFERLQNPGGFLRHLTQCARSDRSGSRGQVVARLLRETGRIVS